MTKRTADNAQTAKELGNQTRAAVDTCATEMHSMMQAMDGIKTSTYTRAMTPKLLHAPLWPVRLAYSLGMDIVNGAFAEGSEFIAILQPQGKKHMDVAILYTNCYIKMKINFYNVLQEWSVTVLWIYRQ